MQLICTLKSSSNNAVELKSFRFWTRVVPIVILLTVGLSAQSTSENRFTDEYVVTTWDTDAGSPFIAATALAQTPDGYLWIGSYEGLARFDGIRFVDKAKAVAPFEGMLVLSMVVDQSGNLWVGTAEGIWRRKNLEWEQFKPKDGLLDGLIYSIACDSQGEIIALAGDNVVRWNGTSFEEILRPETGVKTFTQAICFFDQDDQLWVSSRSYLFRFTDGAWTAVRQVEKGNETSRLLGVGSARDGGVWVAENTVINHLRNDEVIETKPRIVNHQRDEVILWEDDDGNLWEAGERNGLVIHTADGGHLTCTTEDGLSNTVIISLARDREGNIWLGSDGGGIARIRPRSLIAHAERGKLPQPVIDSIAQLDSERLLVGTHGGGVMIFQNGKFGEPLSTEGLNALGDQSWVQAIEIDSDGGIWLGTYQDGLYYLKGEEANRWTFKDLGGRHVYALHLDANDRLWVGVEGGLRYIQDGQITDFNDPSIDWGVINMIAEDRDGRIWASSRDGRLWRHHNDTFEAISSIGQFDVGRVCYLRQDESGELWLTNDRNEIFRQYGSGWIRYDQSHGLPIGEWKYLASDYAGYHWFGSHRGVMRVTKESMNSIAQNGTGKLRCQILNQHDGMKSPRVREGFQDISLHARNGKIWVATIKGLVELDPASIRIPPQSPQIHIEQVREGSHSLKDVILANDMIPISPGTERVNIRYGGTSLSYGEYLNYSYRLEGIDADWVIAGNEPVARITDLQPGTYDFRVRVHSLEDRIEDEAKVTLQVASFWWQRWEVQFLGIFVLIVSITSGITLTVRAGFRRQNERLEQARELAEERLRSSEVQQEMEVATEANRAKSDFLATMSHEIRTPLNGVIGSMDLLRETPLSSEQTEHVNTLGASAETLLAVLNDILDFSKIEAGKITIEQVSFNLAKVLREVIEVAVPRALNKGVELALVIPPEIPSMVVGDSARLRQVLINLVGNAVKFTDAGSVTVRVDAVKKRGTKTTDATWLEFSVMDTGVGIPAASQAHLFDQFTQADASTTRKFGGTGLGLAICKRLVELMGGSINVRSEQARGAEFYFDLPFQTAAFAAPYYPIQRGRAVVLDNLKPSLEAEVALLERCGVSAQGTASSTEALLWLRESEPDQGDPPSWLLLSEVYANSLSADLKTWLQKQVKSGKLAIIFLTCRAKKQTPPSELTVHAVLRKPLLDPAKLKEAISGKKNTAEKAPAEKKSTTFDVPVLLADDEPVNRLVLGKLLKRLGCRVDFANDGEEAVQKARAGDYAVIFMDCRMPVMDGYTATIEILKSVREPPPIIAITANTTVEDRERCTDVGMIDFVSKPARSSDLSRVLKKWS